MKRILGLILLLSLFNCSNEKKPEPTKVQDTQELMEENQFWSIIEICKKKSKNDYEILINNLEKELVKLTPLEIQKFDNQFRKLRGDLYNWDIWGVAYIINGGCSDDCFNDFREWIISNGKEKYYSILQNAENINEFKDIEYDLEGLGYVANDVFEAKTKETLPKGITEKIDIKGDEWEENDSILKNRFPKTFIKWGEN